MGQDSVCTLVGSSDSGSHQGVGQVTASPSEGLTGRIYLQVPDLVLGRTGSLQLTELSSSFAGRWQKAIASLV